MQGERFVRIAAAVAALGGMLFGYDTGVISGALLFIKDDFNLSSTLQEIVVSAVLVGATAGAAVGGVLADRFGRRKMIILAGIIFTLSAIGTAFASSVDSLIAWRCIVGIAIGIASFVSPMYMAEISPANKRGAMVSINQLALTSGIVIAYLVDYALSPIRGWRYMFGVAAVPSMVLVFAMWYMPPSPRWLMSHGIEAKALAVLQRIRGTQDVSGEMNDMRASLSKQQGGIADLLHPALRMALVVGVGLAVFQQITGINTVMYYTPTILGFAGFKTASSSILATAGVGVVNVLFTILAIRLMDRVGRRPLLLMGVIGQVVALIILGAAFRFHSLATVVDYLLILGLAIYVGSFAVGLGPVFWLMISEIYPQKVRGAAMSIAAVANWAMNLVVAVTFLTLVQAMGRPGVFWLYAAIGVAAWIFIYRLVPETKGRTLEQIEEHWRQGKHPREMRAGPS